MRSEGRQGIGQANWTTKESQISFSNIEQKVGGGTAFGRKSSGLPQASSENSAEETVRFSVGLRPFGQNPTRFSCGSV